MIGLKPKQLKKNFFGPLSQKVHFYYGSTLRNHHIKSSLTDNFNREIQNELSKKYD